ncbi:hypothetical protein PSN45_003456 [Yamadazyma tenuis]|uniref:Mis14-domain-containing protein n=1 Tax=Candida tenuis (strain ATCC 10573 / BCRC 21748 / CBS 615 / JCM 9827 / NBRC 10315 / NRRL Y-1498 / VKM Y-70) TaxID=590646 RepID=G3AY26_CANTC|nr:Mis14-domain-containing protein [Yamadazyma tenuis ATCC 10573]EGV65756.1 Mis14-domain-containing protein [Yamadazyma tenuis ATCC 10573]WEJ95925.1 hypothetical protein PSN45_003456 [Yamadazyma tenuis]
MDPGQNHQKLQLTKQELRFIYNQVLNHVLAKLDLHLPTPNNDPMKNKVTNLLHDYLKEVFEMAKHAMVVDGLDMSTRGAASISDVLSLKPKEKTEPFDFELNSKLREILQSVEQETIEVTQLRKKIPQKIDAKYSNVVQDVDQKVSEFLDRLNTIEPEIDIDKSSDDIEDILPRISEIIQDYETHLIQMNELKDTIPKQTAEVEKLSELVQFLEEQYNNEP